MKLHLAIIMIIGAILLSACSFTLAADVTPPPGYIPPTPMPTLGPLYPSQAPDIDSGAATYVEKCAPCHGVSGLGDGGQGKQLPVTVAAFALPETARKASPAQWFTMVSQGNLDRFMPPFISLNEQERWDVVSYAFTLHTNAANVQQGKTLFESNCVSCHQPDYFTQKMMAAKSDENIAFVIMKGQGQMKPVALSEEDSYKVADYLRSLTFALPTPTSTPVAVTETPIAVESGTGIPSTEATPLEGTAQAQVPAEATAIPGIGIVRGSLDNQTGKSLPTDLTVTLRGYEHSAEPNAGPQEILTLTAPIEADGTYSFENVAMPENRIFLSEVTMDGMTLQSEYSIVKAGMTEVDLAPIKLYGMTTDTNALVLKDVTMFFDFANETDVQVFAVYTLSNTSDKSIVVKFGDSQEIPFAKFPANATGNGYQQTQDSAAFVSTTDGFAMPPSEKTYGLIAFASIPKDKKIEFNQPILLATSVRVLVPEGVKAASDQLSDTGVQSIQNINYQTYSSVDLAAGDTLSFTLTGSPKGTSSSSLNNQQTLLIGAGALGLVLILAGVWLYLRDRKRLQEFDEEDEDDGFDSSEDVMDAIIALDDLHRAGKISAEAYQKRRDELKEALKRMT